MTIETDHKKEDTRTNEDFATFVANNDVKTLLGNMLQNVLVNRPTDVVQYCTDMLTFSDPKDAVQDATGLSSYRQECLRGIFRAMDKSGNGWLSFAEVADHARRHGGDSLTEEELREIFRDFDVTGQNKVHDKEFIAFFGRSLLKVSNADFDQVIRDLSD